MSNHVEHEYKLKQQLNDEYESNTEAFNRFMQKFFPSFTSHSCMALNEIILIVQKDDEDN